MPSGKHNSITTKAAGLIFHCSTLLHPETRLLAYHSTYNARIMDLPVSSFVCHLFLLTARGVDLLHGFLFVNRNCPVVAGLIVEAFLLLFFICSAV